VVDEHVLDRLEPDERGVGAPLGLVGVVVETALRPVEHEPAPLPLAHRGAAAAELDGQVAVARAGRELDVRALVEPVAGGLDEAAQVERAVSHRQIARQRTSVRLQRIYSESLIIYFFSFFFVFCHLM